MIKSERVDQEHMPAYSELTRRLGSEYNGMVLHEFYFDNMRRGGSAFFRTNADWDVVDSKLQKGARIRFA